MLLEHERNYGLGMDALVSVCSWNTNGIMVLGVAAVVTVRSWKTRGIMVWAWLYGGDCTEGREFGNTSASMAWAWLRW